MARLVYGTSLWCLLTVVLALLPSVPFLPSAYAETYIGGQLGLALPSVGKGLTDVELTSVSPPGAFSDRALKTSPMYGAKLGFFLPTARWFGLETEIFNTTPHIKQQPATITVPPGSTITLNGTRVAGGTATGILGGDHLRVLTWAPINFMFRYPKARLQPYFGIGPGLFFATVHSTNAAFPGSQSSTRLGLNFKAGAEYFITRRLGVFGEWKYNHTRFYFKENDNQFGFNASYNMHLVAFGLNYHF